MLLSHAHQIFQPADPNCRDLDETAYAQQCLLREGTSHSTAFVVSVWVGLAHEDARKLVHTHRLYGGLSFREQFTTCRCVREPAVWSLSSLRRQRDGCSMIAHFLLGGSPSRAAMFDHAAAIPLPSQT